MLSLLPAKCRHCVYSGKTMNYLTCDYIIFANHSRGCKPEDCDKFKSKNRRILYDPMWPNKEDKEKRNMPFEDDDLTAILMPLYEQGYPDAKIAELGKVSKSRVFKWRRRHALKSTRELKTLAQFDRMKELYDKGYSDNQIAIELGTSPSVVGDWRKGVGLESNYNERMRNNEKN